MEFLGSMLNKSQFPEIRPWRKNMSLLWEYYPMFLPHLLSQKKQKQKMSIESLLRTLKPKASFWVWNSFIVFSFFEIIKPCFAMFWNQKNNFSQELPVKKLLSIWQHQKLVFELQFLISKHRKAQLDIIKKW